MQLGMVVICCDICQHRLMTPNIKKSVCLILGLRKQVLSTQNTLIHIMVRISSSLHAEFLSILCMYDEI